MALGVEIFCISDYRMFRAIFVGRLARVYGPS